MVIVGRVGKIVEKSAVPDRTAVEVLSDNDSDWVFFEPRVAEKLTTGEGVLVKARLEPAGEDRLYYSGVDFQELPLSFLHSRLLL